LYCLKFYVTCQSTIDSK